MEHNGGFIKHAQQKHVRFALPELRKNELTNIWHPSEFMKIDVLLLNYEELFSLKERVPTV